MKLVQRLLCAGLLGLITTSQSHAELVYWTAPNGVGIWHNPSNWSSQQVPKPGDTAVFDISAEVTLTQDVEIGAIQFLAETYFVVATLYLFGHSLQVNGPITITNFIVFRANGGGAVITCTDWLLVNGTWSSLTWPPNTTTICNSLTIDNGSADHISLYRAWILSCETVTVGDKGIFALHNAMTGDIICEGEFWPDPTTAECNPSSTAVIQGDVTLLTNAVTRMSNHSSCPRVLKVEGHTILDGTFLLNSGGPEPSSCDLYHDLITATNGIEGAFSGVEPAFEFTEWSNLSAIYKNDAVDIRYFLLADVDRNGVIGVKDLLTVLGNWGCKGGPSLCPGDIVEEDGVQTVGVRDLLAVLGDWGQSLCERGSQ